MNQLDLEHDNIIVTGGAAGIGLAIAQRLAASGARVSLWDRDEKALKDGAGQLGGQAHTARVDVSDEASVKRAFDETLAALGRVDGMVCSAGITGPNLTTWDYPVADWKQVLDINLTGVFLCNKAAIPHMKANDYGRIVNIASIAGLRPTGSSIAYAASKAGLIHLTRCLAVALAPTITVNCVAPGLIEGTRMAQRIPPAVAESVRKTVVLGRGADVGDIAAQVETFCRADSITGQVLVVDGGLVFH